MKFRSNNILVTGGAGFIGSNFIKVLLDNHRNITVVNLDALTYAGNIKNTNTFKFDKRYTFIKGNICNSSLLDDIFANHKIDGVINFAAESHVDNSIKDPKKFIQTNIIGVYKLLSVAYKNWMTGNFKVKSQFNHARFHQISTDEIYGSISSGSFFEKDQYNPNSPYSASKASADMIVRSFNQTYGLNVTTSISSNNYGPNQHSEKFLPKIISCIISDEEIPIYGDGMNIRNWLFVEDNCEAIIKIFNKGLVGSKDNVGSEQEISNIELVKMVYEVFNKKEKIKYINDRFGHDFDIH